MTAAEAIALFLLGATTMTAAEAIALAQKHVDARYESRMQSSAELCLADAKALMEKGEERVAKNRAVRSLAYTVGILHPDYQEAAK